MVSLKKPERPIWPAHIEQYYQSVAAVLDAKCTSHAPSLLIAYSGGLDSHVLLVAAQRWCSERDGVLRAVYVNHQLQADSDAWGDHCTAVCGQLDVPCETIAVTIDNSDGVSPESAARDARYGVFKQQLEANEYLVTAHHADDQAETLLLQLLRGAGHQGLAAMPPARVFASGLHIRPMLSLTREELEAIALALKLTWIEDNTNADTHYDRNFLRHQVLPVIRERWPSASKTIGRSAAHLGTATSLLRELASQDISVNSEVLDVSTFAGLSADRRGNALRAWILRHGFRPPSTAKLEHLVHDLVLAPANTEGQVIFGGGEIRRHRSSLYIGAKGTFANCMPFDHKWPNREDALFIPETNQVLTHHDLPLPWIAVDEMLRVKSRQGGERIHLDKRPYRQSVKSLLQQRGLPPWQRCRLPFVWRGEQLIGIVGVGFVAPPLA